MTTSTNPNRGHWSPPPLVTHATDQDRGPGRCRSSRTGSQCRPKISTYGDTSASLGDYDHKHGDAQVETYLARCQLCGGVFVGIAPGGVYSDEPDFDSRVMWVRFEGGAS